MDDLAPVTCVVVVLPDEVDVTNADLVREQLRSEFGPGITLVVADMRSTAFCDVSSFRALVTVHDEAGINGAELRLVIGPGAVRRALTVLRLDLRLHVYPSLELARAGPLDTRPDLPGGASGGRGPGISLVMGEPDVQAGDRAGVARPPLDQIA